MTSITDFIDLDGELIISEPFVGNIKCRKLTVSRMGHITGNVVCDHLQLGGRIDGTVICRMFEGNTQGLLHGSVYYKEQKCQARVSGIYDYRDPPSSVWVVVAPEDFLSSDDAFTEDQAALPQALSGDEIGVAAADVELVEIDVTADLLLQGLSTTETAPLEAIEEPAPQPFSKYYPTPPAAAEAILAAVPAIPKPDFVSTGRKVSLPASFF